MINLIKSHWSLVIAPVVLGVIGATACIAQAQEADTPAEPAPDITVTAMFGQYYSGLLDYEDDAWCGDDGEVTAVTLLSPITYWDTGMAFATSRLTPDGIKNLYGSPIHDVDATQRISAICSTDGEDDVAHVRTVRINVEGDAALVPLHVRELGGGYVHDYPHPTHVAEIDVLETRVAEAVARSFAQATQLADIESTVEVDVTAIAALKARDTQFGSQVVNIEGTVEIHATRVHEAITKATGNQRALGLHVGDNTKHNAPSE